MLELKNVSKFYYSKGMVSSGISKINLKFDMGEFVAITGESGSGKSTLLNVISGLDSYEEGEMYINGEETSHYMEEEYEDYRKKYVGNIFQSFNLVNSYTVYQNVELVLLLNGETRGNVKDKVLDILKKVDLYKFRNTKVSKLSGGMKQRVAIARCLAKDTPIIIADEPTGNLDSKNAKSIMKILYEISKDKLVIVVTHNYEQVEEYATRKIKMHDGRVVEDTILRDKNIVGEVSSVKINKIKLTSKLLLGFRNTFNISTKFLLLSFVYFFVLISLADAYGNFNEIENNTSLDNGFYIYNNLENRILVKKKDNSSFTTSDIEKIKSSSNVENVYLNDFVYDYNASLTNGEGIYFSTNFNKLSSLNKSLTYGEMPKNNDEIVIEMSEEYLNYNDYNELLNKEVTIDIIGKEKKVKITGIITKSGVSYYLITSYVSDDMYNYVLTEELSYYGNTKLSINNNLIEYTLTPSSSVDEGKVIINDSLSYLCNKYSCIDNIININYSNLYYSNNLNLSISRVVNQNNYKKIISDCNELNMIYINSNDYNKLYNNGEVYQISVFMNDFRDRDKTIDDLSLYDLYVFKDNARDSIEGKIMKIFEFCTIIFLVIVLFFVSYFVIKLIIKSRNKYYATIRILGGSYNDVKYILYLELFNITNIVYIIFIILCTLVKNNVIYNETISNIVSYINLREYILIYLIINLISILISNRYSRKVFKTSVITSYNMEV